MTKREEITRLDITQMLQSKTFHGQDVCMKIRILCGIVAERWRNFRRKMEIDSVANFKSYQIMSMYLVERYRGHNFQVARCNKVT